TKRPSLQVLPPDARIQDDAEAGCPNAVPEIDVFYRRVRKAFVEPANCGEDLRANRTEPCPERLSVPPRALVNERMGKIPRHRNESGVGGIFVVRAERGCEVWLRCKQRDKPRQSLVADHDVAVDEDDEVPGRVCSTTVAGNGRPSWPIDG